MFDYFFDEIMIHEVFVLGHWDEGGKLGVKAHMKTPEVRDEVRSFFSITLQESSFVEDCLSSRSRVHRE